MTIITRASVGRPLTWDELDGNFLTLSEGLQQVGVDIGMIQQAVTDSQTAATEAGEARDQAVAAAAIYDDMNAAFVQMGIAVDDIAAQVITLGTTKVGVAALAAPNGATTIGWIRTAIAAIVNTIFGKLSERCSVQDFMTDAQRADCQLDTPVLDHTGAINAFFAHLATKNVGVADFCGNFRVTSKVSLIASKTLTLRCSAVITAAFTAEDEILLFKNTNWLKLLGTIDVAGGGGTTYTTRTNGVGIRVDNCGRFSGGFLLVRNAKYKGFQIENGSDAGGGNSSLWSIEKLRAVDCGSGLAGTVRGVRQQITGRADAGGQGSLGQTSVLTLDAVPTGLEVNSLCKIGTTLHILTAAPAGNNITVFPWPDLAITSGNIDFYIGGALYAKGGDTSVGRVDTLDATGCSVEYRALSLYPAVITNFVGQANGIGLAVGTGPNSSSVGGEIGLGYFENNDFDIVKTTASIVSFNLSNTLGVSDLKTFGLSPRFLDNSLSKNYSTLNGITFRRSATTFAPRDLLVSSVRTLSFNQKAGVIETLRANTATITIAAGADGDRLFNNTDTAILIAGSGPNNRPTSTITFVPPSGVAINGGAADASVVFSGFLGPCLFYVRQDSLTAYTVQRCDFDTPLQASATWDPPSVAVGSSTTTAVTVTGAATGDFVQAALNRSLGGMTLSAYVSATDTVTAVLSNNTAGAVDLASSTLRVRVSKL